MLGKLKNIFDSNKRELARLAAVVVKINSLEPDFEALTDAERQPRRWSSGSV